MAPDAREILAAAVAGILVAGGTRLWAADPAQPTTADLQAQINQLQARIVELESRQAATTQEIDQTVAEVIRDADRRSQLLNAEGFTAGYTKDRGFVIQSADKNFLLHPYLQMQLRDITNWRQEQKADGSDQIDNGFELARMKFGFEGNVFTQDLVYAFQWNTDQGVPHAPGTPVLEDAWVRYRFADTWAVQGGQFRDPVFHEQMMSPMRQMAVERSLLNAILENGDNYVEGAALIYDDGNRFRAQGAITNGFGGSNTNFEDPQDGLDDAAFAPNGSRHYDWGFASRAEYLIAGNPKEAWKGYSQFSALGNTTDVLVGGVGSDVSQSGDTTTWWHTIDLQWDPQAVPALGLYGAYVGRYNGIGTPETPGAADHAYDWGYLIQAGYLVTRRIEPFARLDYTRLDNDIAASSIQPDLYEITVGVNYYVYGQSAKFTADLTWLPNGCPLDESLLGILPQTKSENQLVLRVQFQLLL